MTFLLRIVTDDFPKKNVAAEEKYFDIHSHGDTLKDTVQSIDIFSSKYLKHRCVNETYLEGGVQFNLLCSDGHFGEGKKFYPGNDVEFAAPLASAACFAS